MTHPDSASNAQRLLADLSLEMTGKQHDIDGLRDAAPRIASGTRVNITFLGNEDFGMRLAASSAVLALGFTPVPHVSARLLRSEAELVDYLAALRELGASTNLCIVGGDPARPLGPYASSLEVIGTGFLPEHGVKEVSIAGYPEGHPRIPTDVLWRELDRKTAALTEQGLGAVLITQFGFDPTPVVEWVSRVRGRGIDAPIRIGTPGPAGVRRLLRYARRFGVAASASVVTKYGLSLTNLMGSAGPDVFVAQLADRLAAMPASGDIALHLYAFGGMTATATWIEQFTTEQRTAR